MLGSYDTEGKISIDELNRNLRNVEGVTSGLPIESLPSIVTVDGYDIGINEKGNVKRLSELEKAKVEGEVFEYNKILTDTYGNSITIPTGFKIASDSATNVTEGIVIEDATYTSTMGSQFVWIPVGIVYTNEEKTVSKEIVLNRYTFADDGTPIPQGENIINDSYPCKELPTSTYENITAKNIEGFKTSVNNNYGYYIGRYEARINSSGNITEVGTDSVYNNITQPNAAAASRNMYDTNEFTSDLVNSYAWDTAIVFTQTFDDRTNKTKPYSKQSCLNYYGHNAPKGTNNLTDNTMQDKICNVWDMASNCWEWTTEYSSHRYATPGVYRGGSYILGGYTSYRSGSVISNARDDNSFRPFLYL